MYLIRSCSITNTVISLIAHKLHSVQINNQEKFMARSGKLKVHRATSQTISSYSGRFSTDILFSLVSFVFRVFFFGLELKIHILIYIWLCGRVTDFSPSRFPETRLLYFGLNLKYQLQHEMINLNYQADHRILSSTFNSWNDKVTWKN